MDVNITPFYNHRMDIRMCGRMALGLLYLSKKSSSKHVQQASLAIKDTAMLRLDAQG